MSEMMRIEVDAEVCIGSGVCEMLAEDTLIVDEDTGYAKVLGDGVLPSARALELVERCPTQALSASAVDPG